MQLEHARPLSHSGRKNRAPDISLDTEFSGIREAHESLVSNAWDVAGWIDDLVSVGATVVRSRITSEVGAVHYRMSLRQARDIGWHWAPGELAQLVCVAEGLAPVCRVAADELIAELFHELERGEP